MPLHGLSSCFAAASLGGVSVSVCLSHILNLAVNEGPCSVPHTRTVWLPAQWACTHKELASSGHSSTALVA